MTLTGHMLLSSLIGFVSFGFSMAAFIPAMGGNFAKRRISNHWGYRCAGSALSVGSRLTVERDSFADIVFGVQLVMYWNVSKSREKRKLRLYDGPRAKGRGGGCYSSSFGRAGRTIADRATFKSLPPPIQEIIFILSDKPSYYEGQLPWIIGPALSIFFDMCLLASAIVWNKKWKKSNAFKAQDDPDGVVNRKRKHIKDAKRQLLLDEESLDEMIYDQAHANNAGLTEYKANKMASKNPKKSAKLHQKASKIRDEHTRTLRGVKTVALGERHAVAGTRNRPRVVRVQARSKATGQGQATHLFSGTHP
ncbi:hypothetical protein RQP46_001318 [Phenoliferia psychrophenolica]